MDGEVGLVFEQGDFEFLGEKTFGKILTFAGERGGL
jgi:hypothetical protein